MQIVIGMIVKSLAGHDKNSFYVVVKEESGKLFISDGRRRKVLKPKLKSPSHLKATETILTVSQYQTNQSIKKSIRDFITLQKT